MYVVLYELKWCVVCIGLVYTYFIVGKPVTVMLPSLPDVDEGTDWLPVSIVVPLHTLS